MQGKVAELELAMVNQTAAHAQALTAKNRELEKKIAELRAAQADAVKRERGTQNDKYY